MWTNCTSPKTYTGLSGRGCKFVVELGEGVMSFGANLWAWPAAAPM
jgi:hypothetical protein